MRPLEGVIDRSRLSEPDVLKKYSLFFDKVHLLQVSGLHGFYDRLHKSGVIDERRTNAELQCLEDQGFISGIDEAAYQDLLNKLVHSGVLEKDWRLNELFHAHISYGSIISLAISEEFGPNSDRNRPEARNKKPGISENFSDSFVRITSLVLALALRVLKSRRRISAPAMIEGLLPESRRSNLASVVRPWTAWPSAWACSSIALSTQAKTETP